MKNKIYKKISMQCIGYTFYFKNALYSSLKALLGGYTGGYTRLHKCYTF